MLYDCRTLTERDRGIAAAVEAVKRGDLVVLPTDTLYGLGADAFKSYAVTSLLNTKGRGRNMPPPVLVGSRHTLDGLVFTLPQAARDLVEAFWPGALTIIVEHSPSLQWDIGDTGGTVGVRMPMHPVALEVLRETGPMAVSSANKTGQPPSPTAEHARDQLGYAVSVYLEAGELPDSRSGTWDGAASQRLSVPSTIVDVTTDPPRMVRAGAIPLEKLCDAVPHLVGPDTGEEG